MFSILGMKKGRSKLLDSRLKRPKGAGTMLPAAMKLFVVNETPPTVRQFLQLDFWVGKGSKIRLKTSKTLENTGLFRFVVIIP